MLPLKDNLTFVYWLSGALAGLLLLAAATGLIFGWSGLYDVYPASLAGLIGQDMVTLAVGLPLLLSAMWLTRRGSTGGLMLWAGALFYFAYSYYFFLVGGFNTMFLAYVAIVATSLYGLLALLFRVDGELLRARFAERGHIRRVATFLVVTASLFAFMWGGLSVASATAGTTPDPVVHLVLAIDCAILLPLLFFGGAKLWRREPWGYLLAGMLLTKTTTTGFTLAFTSSLAMWWAGTFDPFQVFLAALFGLMAAIGVALLVPYLHSLGAPEPLSPVREAPAPPRDARPSKAVAA